MFGSTTLEVALGLIFVYLLVSMICMAIREGIEAWLKTRASYLEYGIRELLHDKTGKGLTAALYKHPFIFSLFSGDYTPRQSGKRASILVSGVNLPSYIPATNFAMALLDIAARGPDPQAVSSAPPAPIVSLDDLRRNVAKLQNEAVQRVLLMAIDAARGDLQKVQGIIETWYDSTMDRVSGWYKRTTQSILFGVGLAVAIGLNIDTITIADYLYRHDAARAAIIARADTAAMDTTFLSQNYEGVKKDLASLGLPIGWTKEWRAPRRGSEPGGMEWWNALFAPILGWLLTAFAATLGAPFWFDVLNKVIVIRSTVKPHEKSPEEASEDRQLRM